MLDFAKCNSSFLQCTHRQKAVKIFFAVFCYWSFTRIVSFPNSCKTILISNWLKKCFQFVFLPNFYESVRNRICSLKRKRFKDEEKFNKFLFCFIERLHCFWFDYYFLSRETPLMKLFVKRIMVPTCEVFAHRQVRVF